MCYGGGNRITLKILLISVIVKRKDRILLELIYILTALQIYCKDAHYAFYGIDFKPLHEWADDILEPLQSFIDEIKENYYLARGMTVPRGTEINAQSADYVPTALGDNSQILANLLAIIAMAHNKLNEIEEKDAGINDLLGRIDSHLLHHIALINMAIINTKKDK